MMRFAQLLMYAVCFSGFAQPQSPAPAGNAGAPAVTNAPDVTGLLNKIEQETKGLDADVGKLRIEKWKADSASKYQATESAASIQRNISNALPGLIADVRSNPQSLAANFKLYRNLNALHEVVASLAESAGAFGKREEYEMVAPHLAALDDDRRAFADSLVQMTAAADQRIAAADQAARAAAAAAAQQPPKKIIVDDTEPAPTAQKKKPKKKPAIPSSAAASTSTAPPK
jgi:hypothetical protein